VESKRSFVAKKDKNGRHHIKIESFKLEDASAWDVRASNINEKQNPSS
jgi:hypothetical protein